MRRRHGHLRVMVATAAIPIVVLLPAAAPTGARDLRHADDRAGSTLPPKLATPTLSSTTFHLGDRIEVTGTGCVDPKTGSGTGLRVTSFRYWQSPDRGSNPKADSRDYEVQPDGSYSGTFTVGSQLYDGHDDLVVACWRTAVGLPFELGDPGIVAVASIPVTLVAPHPAPAAPTDGGASPATPTSGAARYTG